MLHAFAALAAEAPNPTTPGGMDAMLTTMGKVLDFSMGIFDVAVANPIMAFIVAGSLVGVGVGVLTKVKRAASA